MQTPPGDWLPPHWGAVLLPDAPVLELVVRAVIVYGLLLVVFRAGLRHDLGRMRVADVLLLFLLATGVRQALTGQYYSVADGLITVATLIAMDLGLDYLAFRSSLARRILRPDRRLIVREGRVIFRNARLAMMSRADVEEVLREHGVDSLSDVRAAYLEPNGRISVIRADEPPRGGQPPRAT